MAAETTRCTESKVTAATSKLRPRRTQAERALSTQKKLIDSAIEVLKRKRYVGFRTADVAELAGVSKGAQHHFPSKDMVVLQALEEVLRQTQARALQRIEAGRKRPQQLLELLLVDSKEFFLGEDFLLSLDLMMVDPQSSLGVSVKQVAQQYRLPVEEAWVDALAEAGYPHTQASAVVRLTYAISRGCGIRQLIAPSGQEVDQLLGTWLPMAEALLGLGKARRPEAASGKRMSRANTPVRKKSASG
jgi:AcrR family transcriptional regulator